MRERFQLPISLWRVQYQLLGGHRRMFTIGVVYSALLVLGAFGFRRMMIDEKLTTVAAWMLNGLAAIQIFVVVLGGCNALYRAMLRDYESKMIESHRLTPMSNIAVVLGYLFGATLQIVALFLANLVFGTALTGLAGFSIPDWICGNLFLLNGAVTLWSMVLLSGMRLAKPISPAPFIIGAAALGNAGVLVLPALGLMLSAYPVVFGFQIITGTVSGAAVEVATVAGINVILTVFWLSAAAAKYRRPDLPALNAGRGLMLLALCLVFGTGGMVAYASDRLASVPFSHDPELIVGQWVATMILGLLVALPAIAGAVQCRALIQHGSTLRGWADRVPPVATALIAAGLICLIMGAIGFPVWETLLGDGTGGRLWGVSVAVCALAMLTARAVYMGARSVHRKPVIRGTTFLLLLWAIPAVVDFVRAQAAADFWKPAGYSWLLGCSPAGTLIATWAHLPIRIWPGAIVQCFVAGFLTVLAWWVTRHSRSSPPQSDRLTEYGTIDISNTLR